MGRRWARKVPWHERVWYAVLAWVVIGSLLGTVVAVTVTDGDPWPILVVGYGPFALYLVIGAAYFLTLFVGFLLKTAWTGREDH